MPITLRTEALNKTYTRKVRKAGFGGALRGLFSSEEQELRAVTELSFSIERGERVGLIGENGAGKSTTLKMLTGILVPSSGTVSVLGLNPWRQRRQLAARIGVVFGQRPQLLWDIPVQETFSLLRTMYRIPKDVYDVTYKQAVERLDLGPLLPVAVRKLSLGQRMRCDLAASLLHAPAVAFLDEPTIGLDVSVKEQVREFVRDMQKRFQTTLLLTTHDLKDITETCDRILLLDRGALLFDGSLKDFERRFATKRRIILELERPTSEAVAAELANELLALGGELQECKGHRVVVVYEREGAAPVLTQRLLSKLPVSDIVLEKADIDSMVASIYRPQHKPSRGPVNARMDDAFAEVATLRALFMRALHASFSYKPALLMSMLSAGFAYAIPMLVWSHIYGMNQLKPALPAESLFPYLLIAGCLNFSFAMNVESRIGQRIRMGLIAIDLLRPVDFQLAQLAQALSDGLFNIVLVLPIYVLTLLFWGGHAMPHGAAALAAFFVSVLLSFVILFAVSYIFVQASFVTYSGYGVIVARNALQQTFSGLSAPLILFPARLRAVAQWLPFRHTIHTPVSIYLGWLSGAEVWRALAAQAAWAVALLALGRFLLGRALRRFEIQGG